MTNSPCPATIFNDLLEDSTSALCAGSSEFVLAKIERDAKALARVDAAGALEIRMILSGCRGDLSAATEFFSRAMVLTESKADTLVRRIQFLTNVGDCEAVKATFEDHWDVIRNDPGSILAARENLIACGWIVTCNRVDPVLEKMKIALPWQGKQDILLNSVDAVVDEAQVAQVVSATRKFLLAKRAVVEGVLSLYVPEDGRDPSYLYQYEVAGSLADIGQLEWDLFGHLDELALPALLNGTVVVSLNPPGLMEDADKAA